jgi:ketosteroid isomerase-like protein
MSHADRVKDVYEHIARGDFQLLFDTLAPDAEWNEAENHPYSPNHALVGQAVIQETIFAPLDDDFDTFGLNLDRIVDAGHVVLAEGRYVGKAKTGADLDASFAHVWDFGDTHVVRFQQYSDTWQWRKALGTDA